VNSPQWLFTTASVPRKIINQTNDMKDFQLRWRDYQVPAKEEPRWVIWASFLFF
jgi:hypothetical protein